MKYLNEVEVDECDRHEQLPLAYFCSTCNDNKPMCIYCYYYDHDITHQLHSYSYSSNEINNDIHKLKAEIVNKQKEIASINDKITEVQCIRNDNITFFNKVIKYMNCKYNEILCKLNEYKNKLQLEIESFDKQIKKLMYYQSKQRNNVSTVSLSLSTMINEFNAITCSCFSNGNDMNFFEEKKFSIVYDNFLSMLGKDIRITHKGIYIDTIKLAVIFFPNGNSAISQGKNVSIYLYILNPLNNKSTIKLKMRIEMLTDDISGMNYSKEATCTFKHESRAAGWMDYCTFDYIKNKIVKD
jgi:hypothetical protein